MNTPEIRSRDHLTTASDGMVQVLGTYREIDVRKRTEGEPVYAGHAAIVLDDGTSVYLAAPWSPQAIRSEEERTRHNGQRVAAMGTVVAECPPDPTGAASLTGPCMMLVAAVVSEMLYEAGKGLGGGLGK